MDVGLLKNLIPFAVLAIIPIVFPHPLVMHLMLTIFIYSMVALNWNLVLGYSGILSLGNLSFFGAGGYTTALLTLNLGISPWIGIIAGGLIAIIASLIIGLPVLRLSGFYVAFITLAFQEIIRISIFNLKHITGGSLGLVKIPPLVIGSHVFERIDYYYFALALLFVMVIVIYKIIKSPVGMAFVAVRDSETYAMGRGINIYKSKMLVFIIASFFTGIAGGFYVHYFAIAAPWMVSLPLLIIFEVILIIGGLGKFWGPVIGSFIYIFLFEYLRVLGEYRLIAIALIVILVIIYAPEGVAAIPNKIRQYFTKRINEK